jgi:pimeloyl-ACP methyl ester carboxylesterase
MTPTSEIHRLPSGRIHVLRWSPPQPRECLVLVHGLGDNAWVWEGLAEVLHGRFDLVAPELPGHGGSASGDAARCDVDRMAACLGELVDRLALPTPTLVGHSLGGQVALRAAVQRPGRHAGLVLLDYAPELPADSATRLRAAIAAAQRVHASRDDYLRLLRYRHPLAASRHLQSIAAASLRPCPGGFEPALDPGLLADAANWLRSEPCPTAWHELERLSLPVSVVRGGCSSILSREMAQRVAHACRAPDVHEIPLAGHSVQVDNPLRLASALWPAEAPAPRASAVPAAQAA